MKCSMGIRHVIGVVITLLLIMALALGTGCGTGSAKIRLQGMSLGAVTMDGKPVEGLPSQGVDILLEISSEEISVSYANGSTILTLDTEGAAVEISPSGVVLKGIKPEQVKVEWAVSK